MEAHKKSCEAMDGIQPGSRVDGTAALAPQLLQGPMGRAARASVPAHSPHCPGIQKSGSADPTPWSLTKLPPPKPRRDLPLAAKSPVRNNLPEPQSRSIGITIAIAVAKTTLPSIPFSAPFRSVLRSNLFPASGPLSILSHLLPTWRPVCPIYLRQPRELPRTGLCHGTAC